MKLQKSELHYLLLGVAALIFFAVGGTRVLHSSNDFVPVYTGARCLVHGCNPYDTAQLEQQYFSAGGHAGELPSWEIDVPVYPPSTFLVLAPLSLLQYPAARLLWFLINGALFVTAAAAVVSLGPQSQKWPATILVSIVLATSGILLVLGQPAILAISLLILGCYLLLRDRFLWFGALLLMLSLAIKPQIGCLIVLYLVVQRAPRRYAAAALAGSLVILLGAIVVLQQHPGSTRWLSTLRANLSATLSPGGSADPRPANQQSVGDINLQALTSIYFTEAPAFNLVAYAIFLSLLTVWAATLLRAKVAAELHLVALGALAVLTLTPVYHRFYDTRLLLFTIPATVIVLEKRRLLGLLIAGLTVLGVVSVQYRLQDWFLQHGQFQTVLHSRFLFSLLLRQQNLEMVALFSLYLVAMHSMRFSFDSITEQVSPYRPVMTASL
jgi:Glycosyltransferase family 87